MVGSLCCSLFGSIFGVYGASMLCNCCWYVHCLGSMHTVSFNVSSSLFGVYGTYVHSTSVAFCAQCPV